jgi:methionine transaminase
MIDIKKIHPGITYLNNLSSLVNKEIVNLASENTDLMPHKKLIKAAQKAIAGKHNQYTDLNGYLPLREKVSQFIQKEYTYAYNPDEEVTITAGSSQAITSAISAFIREGDEVILFEPAFYSYDLIIMANGGRPVYIPLKRPEFYTDWSEVQKVINSRTKMIIINSPHYPTGSILSAGDMEKLAKIIHGTKIVLLSDESFNQIVYEGYEHQSVARYPKIAENALIFSSFGKVLHTEGWKLGYCLAPSKLSASFRKVHHLQTFAVNTPFQVAIAEVLSDPDMTSEVAKTYQAKRDMVINGLKNSRFKITPSKGTYFQLLNYGGISDEKEVEFSHHLLENQKIAVMPLSFFYHDLIDQKFVRLCFARTEETLTRAIDILNRL